jgi:hypothetical protein
MPWFSSLFLGGVIVLGAASSTQAMWQTETQALAAMVAIAAAGTMLFGLHLVTHRFGGPLLIAAGTAALAWSLWWTAVVPVAAVAIGVAGLLRARRVERLLGY